jgi:hypothetical protein
VRDEAVPPACDAKGRIENQNLLSTSLPTARIRIQKQKGKEKAAVKAKAPVSSHSPVMTMLSLCYAMQWCRLRLVRPYERRDRGRRDSCEREGGMTRERRELEASSRQWCTTVASIG